MYLEKGGRRRSESHREDERCEMGKRETSSRSLEGRSDAATSQRMLADTRGWRREGMESPQSLQRQLGRTDTSVSVQ